MSVEMMENDHPQDKQELRQHYCKATNRSLGFGAQIDHDQDQDQDQDHHGGDHQGLRMKPAHHDHANNKHSYFLRAKTPRFLGFQVEEEEEGEFKRPVSRDHSLLSEEEDLANCLVMLSNKHNEEKPEEGLKGKEVVEKGTFQCKACKKVFNSHQALGGHRASHKKVKGCFASKIEGLINDEDEQLESIIQEDHQEPPPPPPPEPTRKRTKMHECSVCRRVFSSGQALGGHKRCHWLTTSTDNAFIPNFHDFHYTQQLCKKPPNMIFTKPPQNDHLHHPQLDLNLNLPPTPNLHQKRDNNNNNNNNNNNGNEGDDDGRRDKTDEASTRLCLQQWTHQNQGKTSNEAMERSNEEGCGVKLRKLSDLRDVNLDGGWLQMGIPSTTLR